MNDLMDEMRVEPMPGPGAMREEAGRELLSRLAYSSLRLTWAGWVRNEAGAWRFLIVNRAVEQMGAGWVYAQLLGSIELCGGMPTGMTHADLLIAPRLLSLDTLAAPGFEGRQAGEVWREGDEATCAT